VLGPLLQPREEIIDLLEVPFSRAPESDEKVFSNGEGGEDPSPLRDKGHPHGSSPEVREARQIRSFENDLPAPGRCKADDGPNQGGLAHAISSQESNDRPLGDMEGNPLEDIRIAVVGMDIFNPQHRLLNPKVDFLYGPVCLDRIDRSVCDDLPVMEHRYKFREFEGDIHIVFDD